MRTIHRIVKAEKVNMGGIILDQALPVQTLEQIDPFLLIHHWNQHYQPGNYQKELGVGPHPHRGFSPVTFIFKGGLHHRDSRSNSSVIYAGGTQWINSGMGIVHSERPAREIAENGGDLELIQFWINLPSRHKFDQPAYIPLPEEQTPHFLSDDENVKVSVVAGEFNGVEGAVHPISPLKILRLDIAQKAGIKIPVQEDFNTLLYLLDGALQVSGHEVTGKTLLWFENGKEDIELEASENTRAILLAGKPLEEPVAASGPFVMNTDTEILEAMRDYRMGKMGILVEDFS